MISEGQINLNKNRFISLLDHINREGFRKNELIQQLNNSDFFYAPASTKFHGSFKGGLVQHCLNVYDTLVTLVNSFKDKDMTISNVSEESIIIVALFHDFSKMNYYDKSVQNKKVYSPDGKKFDEMGNFDWVAVPSYLTKQMEDRFIYGNHEEVSELMTRTFIPLSLEESVAILNHMGGRGFDSAQTNISEIWKTYPLALMLNIADQISSYIMSNEW